MLQALVSMDEGVTQDEEKRKRLKAYYLQVSVTQILETAYHQNFQDEKIIIPSMSFLSELKNFIRSANEMDIGIDTVEVVSALYKVHPDTVDMNGSVPANQFTVLGEYRDLLEKSLGNAT